MNKLSDKWVLWYHHINDNNWGEESYMKVAEINTVEDFIELNNSIQTYTAGMFFVMREDIFPRWEDVNNIDGGYWSFRITKKDLDDTWFRTFAALISNKLTKQVDKMDEINGISMSPKINNCIIKIWNNDYKKNSVDIITNNIPNIILADALYKKHQDQSDLIKLGIIEQS